MFKDNKYTKWYYAIIQKASTRNTPNSIEKHHIIPTCLNGTNKKSNIALLSPREHYICHLLLTKMTEGQERYKMAFALSMMSNIKNIGNGRYTSPNSRLYEYSRQLFTEAILNYWTDDRRKQQSKNTSRIKKGVPITESHKESLRNKVWTKKAIRSRINNCLKSAQNHKGKSWYYDPNTNKSQFYLEAEAPLGWLKGRPKLNLTDNWDERNKVLSKKYKGKRLSTGRRVGHWFCSPSEQNILFCPFKITAQELQLSAFKLKKLIKNKDYHYDGWKYIRVATKEEIAGTK